MNRENYAAMFADKDFQDELVKFLKEHLKIERVKYTDAYEHIPKTALYLCNKEIMDIEL